MIFYVRRGYTVHKYKGRKDLLSFFTEYADGVMCMKERVKQAGKHKIGIAIQIALLIGVTAQVRMTVLEGSVEGFVVALDVVILGVFIYCYNDISPLGIVALSAVFSPLFRSIFTSFEGKSFNFSMTLAFPDAAFFLGYGIMFMMITSYLFREPRKLPVFAYITFLCDLFGNIFELTVRSVLEQHVVFSTYTIAILMIIAVLRTIALLILIIAIDTYSGNRISNVKREEYETMLSKFIIIHEEINLMDKNFYDVESAMTEAYNLYSILDSGEYPEELSKNALEIAKKTHEIKADYNNVITMLKGLYDTDQFTRSMTIQDIVNLEIRNAQEFALHNNVDVHFRSNIKSEFEVKDTFKLMSVIRNIMINSVEAIATKKYEFGRGLITVVVDSFANESGTIHKIEIEDNGSGIPNDRIESVFRPGFSTKFDAETGYIYRGLGLSIVKEYIERDFGGTIKVDSELGRKTRFTITIPDNPVRKETV